LINENDKLEYELHEYSGLDHITFWDGEKPVSVTVNIKYYKEYIEEYFKRKNENK
jgi:hypothetical protein